MLRLVQGVMRVRRQDRGWHQRVAVLQDGHPGGQAAAERRGDDLPQRLGFVQDVVNEERRGSLRGRRGRVVQTHGVDFDRVFFFWEGGVLFFSRDVTSAAAAASPPQRSWLFNAHAA